MAEKLEHGYFIAKSLMAVLFIYAHSCWTESYLIVTTGISLSVLVMCGYVIWLISCWIYWYFYYHNVVLMVFHYHCGFLMVTIIQDLLAL